VEFVDKRQSIEANNRAFQFELCGRNVTDVPEGSMWCYDVLAGKQFLIFRRFQRR